MADAETNGTGPDEPVFDFSRVNRKWGKRWLRRFNRATELQIEMEDLRDDADDDMPDGDRKQAIQRLNDITHELERIGEEQEQLVAMVLVSVPRDWLSDDAPDDLDWSEAESLDWLLESEYPALITALQLARQGDSKN